MEGTCESARRHGRVARVEGPVEVLSGAVGARAGVVAAEDEVRHAVVLADEAVPDGLARAAHVHGEREHADVRGQDGRVLGIAAEHGLGLDVHHGDGVVLAVAQHQLLDAILFDFDADEHVTDGDVGQVHVVEDVLKPSRMRGLACRE